MLVSPTSMWPPAACTETSEPESNTTVTSLFAGAPTALPTLTTETCSGLPSPTGNANVTEPGSALSRSRTSTMLLIGESTLVK